MAGEMLRSQSGLCLFPGQVRVSHRVAPSLPCRTLHLSASSASRQGLTTTDRMLDRVATIAQAQAPGPSLASAASDRTPSGPSLAASEPAGALQPPGRQGTARTASPGRGSSTAAAASGAAARAQASTARGAATSPSEMQLRGSRRTGTGTSTGERPSSMSAVASSNGWKLHCRRELQLQFPGTRESVEAYLAQPEQIVHVAFPDSSRLKQLGPTRWQARLKPVTFFHITATPVCTIRAWYEEDPDTGGRLRLASESLKLEFIGAPAELTRVRLRLLLDGNLQPLGSSSVGPGHTASHMSPKAATRHTRAQTGPGAQGPQQRASTSLALQGAGQEVGRGPNSSAAGSRGGVAGASLASSRASCLAGGCVDLGVVIEELPLALTFIPAAMASQVGSAILSAILDAMKGALQNGLVTDFSLWQQRQVTGTPRSPVPAGTTPPAAARASATTSAGTRVAAAGAGSNGASPVGAGGRIRTQGGQAVQMGH